MSHTSTMTWVNPITAEQEYWQRVEKNILHLYGEESLAPKTWHAWVEHRSAYGQLKLMRAQLQLYLQKICQKSKVFYPIFPAFGGKQFSDNRASVLGEKTAWSPHAIDLERYGGQIWPGQEEMRHEGDERTKSGYDRFLPLVRNWDPANNTVSWKFVRQLPTLKFDQVRPVPMREDIYTDEECKHVHIGAEEAKTVLGSELVEAMEESEKYIAKATIEAEAAIEQFGVYGYFLN